MKRKFIKKLFAFLLICSIFTFNAFNIGAAYNNALEEQGIEITQTKYVRTFKSPESIHRIMSESSFQSLANSLDKQELSDYEKNVQILKELGFEDITIEGMAHDEVANMFKNALNIATQTQYRKSSADGTTTVVSEEDCLTALETIAENREIAILSSDNDQKEAVTSEDGYMRITISCVYIDPATVNNQKGKYMIYTWYEWLNPFNITPNIEDAISLYCDRFSWPNASETGAYYSSMYYKGVDYGNVVTSTPIVKTTEDLMVNNDGVFYTWNMPFSSIDMQYLQIYMHVRTSLYYPDFTNSFNVFAKYVDVDYGIFVNDITFDWNILGTPGVYLSGGFGATSKEYYCHVEVRYTP